MTPIAENPSEVAGEKRYGLAAIVLHWLIAALLIFQVGLGLRMQDARGPAKFATFQVHKSVGITILLLMAVRLLWRWRRKPPVLAVTGWERTLAYSVHLLFYGLLLALPLSGWLIISTSRIAVPTLLYGVIPWPHLPGFAQLEVPARDMWRSLGENTHVTLVYLLYLLVALHVAGALKHHFLDRKSDLARMAPGIRPGRLLDPRLIAIGLGVVLAASLGWQLLPIGPTGQPHAVATPSVAGAAPTGMPVLAALSEPAVSAAAGPDAAASSAQAAVDQPVAAWAITQGSSLKFRTVWSGEPIDGGFKRFDGVIAFSPDHLDQSHVLISVNTGSVFSGDGQRDETLQSQEWFAVPSFPAAVFKADRFSKTGQNRYLAKGTLRMKGLTLPLSLPFTLTIDGDRAVMHGTASIDRIAYKIGEGEYAATTEIPAAVRVDVVVNATRR